MDKGLWVWPADQKTQRRVVERVSESPHLAAALSALAKSKDGLSNSQLDDAIGDNSNWMTLWVVRQLTALGFADYTVDFFGGPGKYRLTDLGKSVQQFIAGSPPAPPRAPTPAAAPPQSRPA